ncbi:hypothetical protein CAOG_04373 [Capsaspora owczarzaki ATCC 30864]|uniref:ditrans,polycis-polyprenyl diphosphate synthase [(2E,6E)-farnesyldiphosphate specific] n=1 Tax=Capsaspora owczarzaki (strain ATCC 30864) TaxID=595528 RepID=A0A0D2VRT6_CAPO3|nr:hypothetical protein CAOG_04373 [Capsaspora owczarzaki ATCC 30864]KJE93612.1 hypothetical protein, variant [Capsaspora owczarzaki ATCC 30864]|eukprot:XP_004348201.1 hypothetical protein CAOG_04373 [Capsaspora owczarzaki ATCC 30864]
MLLSALYGGTLRLCHTTLSACVSLSDLLHVSEITRAHTHSSHPAGPLTAAAATETTTTHQAPAAEPAAAAAAAAAAAGQSVFSTGFRLAELALRLLCQSLLFSSPVARLSLRNSTAKSAASSSSSSSSAAVAVGVAGPGSLAELKADVQAIAAQGKLPVHIAFVVHKEQLLLDSGAAAAGERRGDSISTLTCPTSATTSLTPSPNTSIPADKPHSHAHSHASQNCSADGNESLHSNINSAAIEQLADAAAWAIGAGARYVSVFDDGGILKSHEMELSAALRRTVAEDLNAGELAVSIQISSTDSDAALAKDRPVVYILSPMDGRTPIVDVALHLAKSVQSKKLQLSEIDVPRFTSLMQDMIPLPEPELLFQIGRTHSLVGYLPWHIRVTEIFHIRDLEYWNYAMFIHLLHLYSKCEQRYGK